MSTELTEAEIREKGDKVVRALNALTHETPPVAGQRLLVEALGNLNLRTLAKLHDLIVAPDTPVA